MNDAERNEFVHMQKWMSMTKMHQEVESQIDENIRQFTGADAYGKDAMAAVAIAKSWA